MSEYIVDFGDEKSSAFVRLAMAQAETNGARLCEEVVRCKDCAHGMREGTICAVLTHDWEDYWFNVEPEGFCKWGERKGNE